MLSSLPVLITGLCLHHVPTFFAMSVTTAYAHKRKLIKEVFLVEGKCSED